MSRLRIALLNAAHDGRDSRRNFRRELDADVVEYDVTAGDLPDAADVDGCVVSGSRASVYWDEDWIEPTRRWVAAAIDDGLPVLGVCFGHQLVADALGGTVESMGEYEIGYREIDRDGDGPLLAGIDERFLAFTTHSDVVADVPPGAEVLATNDYGVHAFRKGHAFGVQFHPEYDTDTAESVTRGKELSDERVQAVLDGITSENYRAACEAKQVFDNFLAYVREVRYDATAAAETSAAGD